MKNKLGSLAIAVAAFAMACADPATGPDRGLVPDGVSAAISNTLIVFPGGTFTFGAGTVKVCKAVQNMPAGLPAADRTFSFTVSGEVPGNLLVASPFNIVVPNNGAETCVDVYHTTLGNVDGAEQVVVTEGNAPNPTADWSFVEINTIRELAQAMFNNGLYALGNCAPAADNCLGDTEVGQVATVKINHDMSRKVTFTNEYTAPPPPPLDNEGCTPGYWKQSHHFDSYPAGYTPGMNFNTALGLPNPNGLYGATYTLLQGLTQGGGGKNALARHAAAAILNAASGDVDYAYTVAEVQALVLSAVNNNALIESVKNLLADANEGSGGCPLN